MLDARALTAKTKGNPDSWADVKQRLPLLSQKPYYSKLTYGYARGHEAYAYVENIRKYQISLVGYLQEKEKQATEAAMQLAQDYAVSPTELGKEKFPFLSFLSQSSSNYLTHSPSLLFSRKGSERNKLIRRGLRFFLRFNFLAAHAKEVTEQRRALIPAIPL